MSNSAIFCSHGCIIISHHENINDSPLEMTNKLVPVVLPEPVPVLTANPRIDWYGYGYEESPTFSIGYEDGHGDVHIPAIIPVSTISPFPFKLLKYS